MKTFRLIALLALAALAACAEPITAPPVSATDGPAMQDNGQGQMGGGTRD